MHWFLLIGINWSPEVSMGSFDNLEACSKAMGQLTELIDFEKMITTAECLPEEVMLLLLEKQKKR